MRPFACAKLTEEGVPLEFNTGGVTVKPGDVIILSNDSGDRYAIVVPDVPTLRAPCTDCSLKADIPHLARLATKEDDRSHRHKLEREGNAYRSCLMKIKERGLPMKLIRVEQQANREHTTFYFTAEHRIDFRTLVRELAREFQMRIEMRQVGPRDATGMLGGYGSCGRPLCCSSWLSKFRPISIRMAKRQNLSLNPSKLTGQCGRLKCCLAYEDEEILKADLEENNNNNT